MKENKLIYMQIGWFRQVMHMAFCWKHNEDSRCPKKCPFRAKNLRPDNWGRIKLRDMLEVRR